MEFGQKLREARTKAGLTQENVAQQLGVSRQTMSNWENNRSYPDLASVLKLSDLYGLSVDEMLREDAGLRKKVEQRQENIKRYCSWVHDLGILLMPVAMVLAFFERTGTAVFVAVLGFVIFSLPHVVYVGRFGMPWKLAALRVLSLGMWLTGIMLRRIMGDRLTDGWWLVYGGLLLQSFVNHRLKDFTGMITKRMTAFSGFVIAIVIVLGLIPIASDSMEKGDFNKSTPFNSREYRVAEVRHGDIENLPLVKLWKGNSVYVTFPGEEEVRLDGAFTYVTQPENSPHKGVWEMIPETDTQKLYRVTVEGDDSVVLAGFDSGAPMWEYGLEYAPMMGVQIMDSLGLVTGSAQWYYDGFLDPSEKISGLPLRGKGELRLSIPGNPETITVLEEYHKDGQVEYREFTLERNKKDRYTMKLEADKEAEEEYAIYRVPYEDGEFVLRIGFMP